MKNANYDVSPENPQMHYKRVSFEDLPRPVRVSFDTHQTRVPLQTTTVPGQKSFPTLTLPEQLSHRTWGRIVSNHDTEKPSQPPFQLQAQTIGEKKL